MASSAATVPDLAFSDGNSGFKLRNPAQINVVVGGAAVAQFNGDRLDLGSFGSSKQIWAGAGNAAAPETTTLTSVNPKAALSFFLISDDTIGIFKNIFSFF